MILILASLWILSIFSIEPLAISKETRKYSWPWPNFENQDVKTQSLEKKAPELIKLRLKTMANVLSNQVRFGQVAECDSPTLACTELLTRVIMDSPRPGKSQKFSVDQILEHLGEKNRAIDFLEGHEKHVKIVAQKHAITENEIQSSLEKILESYSKKYQDTQISIGFLKLIRPWNVRPHEYRFEFLGFDFDENLSFEVLFKRYNRRVNLEVKSIPLEPSQQSSSRQLLVKFGFKKQTLVATENIKKNLRLNSRQFKTELKEVFNLNEWIDGTTLDFSEFVVKRSLTSGAVLAKSNLRRPLLVERGQLLRMKLEKAHYTVAAKVKAKDSGNRGEVIRVLYEPTQKIMRARIVSGELVEKVGVF